MKYGVDVSEAVQIEVDVGPGAPPLDRLTFEFDVPVERVPAVLRTFGSDGFGRMEPFGEVGEHTYARYGIPVTRAGEVVGRATVQIWGV